MLTAHDLQNIKHIVTEIFIPLDNRLARVETRLEGLEKKVELIETRLEGLEKKVELIETRLEGLEKKVAKSEKSIKSLKNELIRKSNMILYEYEKTYFSLKNRVNYIEEYIRIPSTN